MSDSEARDPVASIATAYYVNEATQIALAYSQALKPLCQITGADQTVTPNPSPSR